MNPGGGSRSICSRSKSGRDLPPDRRLVSWPRHDWHQHPISPLEPNSSATSSNLSSVAGTTSTEVTSVDSNHKGFGIAWNGGEAPSSGGLLA